MHPRCYKYMHQTFILCIQISLLLALHNKYIGMEGKGTAGTHGANSQSLPGLALSFWKSDERNPIRFSKKKLIFIEKKSCLGLSSLLRGKKPFEESKYTVFPPILTALHILYSLPGEIWNWNHPSAVNRTPLLGGHLTSAPRPVHPWKPSSSINFVSDRMGKDFLKRCNSCNAEHPPNVDIYMYMDKSYCSEDCRNKQIRLNTERANEEKLRLHSDMLRRLQSRKRDAENATSNEGYQP